MTTVGTHLTDVRAEIEGLILDAVDGVNGLPALTQQMLSITAQRLDWRKRVQDGTLSAPWVVVRYGRLEPWQDGPAAVLSHVLPLDVYYIADQADNDDSALRADLDQAAGGIIEAFRGATTTFTAMEGWNTEFGDQMDANATFLQYKLPFEGVKVSFRLVVAYP